MWDSGKLDGVGILLKTRWNYVVRKDMELFFRGRYKELRYPGRSSSKKYWNSYRKLLIDEDEKKLGVFNVLSDYFWVTTKDDKVIPAWNKAVNDDFGSTITMANSDKDSIDIKNEQCRKNLHRQYIVTDDNPAKRSALLTHNRFQFVRLLDELIDKTMLKKLDWSNQDSQKQNEYTDEIKKLYNVRKECVVNKRSEETYKSWFDMINKNSFLLHLNDTRDENTPVKSYSLLELRPFRCKRIELVTVTFLDGLVADDDFRNSYMWFYGEMSVKNAQDLRSLWDEVITSRESVDMDKLVQVAMVQWLAYFFAEIASKNLDFFSGYAKEDVVDDKDVNLQLRKKKKSYKAYQEVLEGYQKSNMEIPLIVQEHAESAYQTYREALETSMKALGKGNGDYEDLEQELQGLPIGNKDLNRVIPTLEEQQRQNHDTSRIAGEEVAIDDNEEQKSGGKVAIDDNEEQNSNDEVLNDDNGEEKSGGEVTIVNSDDDSDGDDSDGEEHNQDIR